MFSHLPSSVLLSKDSHLLCAHASHQHAHVPKDASQPVYSRTCPKTPTHNSLRPALHTLSHTRANARTHTPVGAFPFPRCSFTSQAASPTHPHSFIHAHRGRGCDEGHGTTGMVTKGTVAVAVLVYFLGARPSEWQVPHGACWVRRDSAPRQRRRNASPIGGNLKLHAPCSEPGWSVDAGDEQPRRVCVPTAPLPLFAVLCSSRLLFDVHESFPLALSHISLSFSVCGVWCAVWCVRAGCYFACHTAAFDCILVIPRPHGAPTVPGVGCVCHTHA